MEKIFIKFKFKCFEHDLIQWNQQNPVSIDLNVSVKNKGTNVSTYIFPEGKTTKITSNTSNI